MADCLSQLRGKMARVNEEYFSDRRFFNNVGRTMGIIKGVMCNGEAVIEWDHSSNKAVNDYINCIE
jgi:hypothetical protein